MGPWALGAPKEPTNQTSGTIALPRGALALGDHTFGGGPLDLRPWIIYGVRYEGCECRGGSGGVGVGVWVWVLRWLRGRGGWGGSGGVGAEVAQGTSFKEPVRV